MKLRRILPALLCLLALSLFAPMVALADLGPHLENSTTIHLRWLQDKNCYVTLLSNKYYSPTFTWVDNYSDEQTKVVEKMAHYASDHRQMEDEYYFLPNFAKVDAHGNFKWGTEPPQQFKVLVYFVDTDTFAISDGVYKRYALKSYFTADMSLVNPVENGWQFPVTQDPPGAFVFLSFAARAGLTILIELAVALFFGYRAARQRLVIVFANILTQLILNISLALFCVGLPLIAFLVCYLLLELLVCAIEAGIYAWAMPRAASPSRYREPQPIVWRTPILYSLAANAASFGVGLGLAKLLPSYF